MDDFIRRLKEQVDIVRVVGEYVPLRKAGPQRFKACCPFHEERTPSFHVHAGDQFYKCFGCGEGGDVIKFVEKIERLTFWEAVKHLAERHGIPLPQRGPVGDDESKRRGRLQTMLDIAAESFVQNLRDPLGEEAREYLERRGVTPSLTAEFQLGLSDRSGQGLLRLLERRGFERDEMVEAGLVLLRQDGSGHYDRFRGRLMFPIHSESGRVVGFGGRALAPGDEPKYLNSPESPMYHKSDILFNLNRARKAIQEVGYAIVVEGYMDVIGVWSAGMANVVAPCGTSLTPHQIRALKRHAPSLILNFDPDRAGSNAAERAIGVVPVEEDMQLRICQLPGGLDPDEYVREHGPDAYRQALASAPSYWHWLADRHRSREDSASPEARSRLFQVLLREIHRVPDRVKRLAIASDLAEYTGLTQGMVLEEFRKAAAERRPVRAAAVAAPQLDPNEVLLFFALLRNPEARVQIAPYLSTLEVVRSYQSWPVLREALRLAEAGVEPSYANLEPRLEPAQRALLQSLLLDEQEQAGHSGITTAQAIACVHALAKLEKESHRSALKAQAKEAEKRGDLEEALRLSGEITRLERGGN